MAAAAVATRVRNVLRSTLRSNNGDSFLLCNALHTKNFSASSNNNRNDNGGISSFDDLNRSRKTNQPEFESHPNLNPPGKPSPSHPGYNTFSARTSKAGSLEDIRKNLSEFRMKSAPPMRRNFDARKPSPGEGNDSKDRLVFESIRDSLRRHGPSGPERWKSNNDKSLASFSLKEFGQSLRLQPEEPGQNSDSVSSTVFGRKMREKAPGGSRTHRTQFMKIYSYDELGQKLRKLRPEGKEGEELANNRFSLTELNERLLKLREMEEKESELNVGGLSFNDLRESLHQLSMSTEKKDDTISWERFSMGGQTIPKYMTSPPKDDLVERYFHPDNLSAEEKMKIELKKVREEFKKHEADCGSSSVQVAQLTAKIKYLGKALRKKDKHSWKGLQEMIQKRKKLLKYLRRTDWDSYCFVISKLGLRDNPDYKT